jgi:hypothetical protein
MLPCCEALALTAGCQVMAARLYRMTVRPAVELAKVTMWLFLTKARLKKGRMVTLLATALPARCVSEPKPNTLA